MRALAGLYERACSTIPGGVNSPVRAMGAIGREPVFIERGEGAELIDSDGRRYIDYVCSWGALLAGHAHPLVVEAVQRAARGGTSFGAPTQAEIELAESVAQRVPGAEMTRLTSSGTEAAMTAIRIARAATGRERILKFAGAYHGHSDGLLAQAGSGLATLGIPSSPGVPEAIAALTVVVPWNDPAAFEEALQRHEIACVIAEPCPANMGVVPAEPGFLELLRERTRATGALLVFDEVITGFRVARGGMAERSGIEADLVVLGKIIGGGLPLAAVAGRRDLMELLAPAGDVYQAGTLSGNPLAVAAGLATLELADAAAYERLSAITQRLAAGLGALDGVSVASVPGLLTVFFSDRPVRNLDDARACDTTAFGAWCRELLERGIYPPPSQFEAWFPSLAHSDEQVEATIEAAREALR